MARVTRIGGAAVEQVGEWAVADALTGFFVFVLDGWKRWKQS